MISHDIETNPNPKRRQKMKTHKNSNLKAQLTETGCFSKDNTERENAYLEQDIDQACDGSINALNALWKRVKAGTFSEQDYQDVKKQYNGN